MLSFNSILSKKEQYDQAIACYDKALEKDPNNDKVLSEKGGAFFDLKMYDQAIACYDKALEIDPNDAAAWYDRGLSLNKVGQEQEAKKSIEKARDLGMDI